MVASDGSLRASEFAATLNGENPRAIWKTLREFVTTVRKERRMALEDENEPLEDESWSDEDDSQQHLEEPPTKKYKASEAWKADTASYHVPFVGTAVAKGERAEVVRGEWPTGLLKAYLESSPLALELLNEDLAPGGTIHRGLIKKKQAKLSRAISKAHQLALAELLTAAISTERLGGDASDNPTQKDARFLKDFAKVHLPRLFELLNEETERGRGKPGTLGGCDTLVAPILKVFQYFSMISISNARLVARHLDESLLDGVLRVCLRPLPNRKEGPSEASSRSKAPRIEAMKLATTLLEANDAAVTTYICTGGSKERKVKPGILFIALREGLASETAQDDNYNDAAADMLERLRLSMTSKHANARLFFNLLSKDPLQHLCRLSTHAPPLTKAKNTFLNVIEANDSESVQVETGLEDLGIEARRLLFPLLCDSTRSPFLPQFGADQVARSMIRLLESKHSGIELRHFLLHCTNQNPCLMEEIFGLLTLPDPKNNLGFLSRTSFIAMLYHNGPSPITCLKTGERQTSVEDVLPTFLPMKLKGQFFAKALRNGSHLVQLESLKMILFILHRFRTLRSEGARTQQWDDLFVHSLTTATFQFLPDLQMLLSLRTRFDEMRGNRCGAILSDHLFRVIETYVDLLPSLVPKETFDWMKLLPGDVEKFHQSLPIVQFRILKCLLAILGHCQQRDFDHLLLSSKIVFEIMLSTRNKKIHGLCQEIISLLMTTALVPRIANENAEECVREEVETWIDAISDSTLPMLFKTLQEVTTNPWSQIAFLGKAWNAYNVTKKMNFSPLLSAIFSSIGGDLSSDVAAFIGQVAARRLVSVQDPVPLAAAIVYAGRDTPDMAKHSILAPLFAYAQAIVEFSDTGVETRISRSTEFLTTYFAKNSPCSKIPRLLCGAETLDALKLQNGTSVLDLPPTRLVFFHQVLNHTIVFVGDSKMMEANYWLITEQLLSKILVNTLLPVEGKKASRILKDVYAIQKNKPNPNFDRIDMLVLTCPNYSLNEFIKNRKFDFVNTVYSSRNDILSKPSGKSQLLLTSLAKDYLPHTGKEKVQLSLVSDKPNDFSDIGLRFMLSCFQIESRQFDDDIGLEENVLETLVNAWVWVGKQARETGRSTHREVKARLSAMMTDILKTKGRKAASLLMKLEKFQELEVLDLCLDLTTKDAALRTLEKEFLDTLLGIDAIRFLNPLQLRMKDMTPDNSEAWTEGYLDQAIETVLVTIRSSTELFNDFSDVIYPQAVQRLGEAIPVSKSIGSLGKDFVYDKVAPLAHVICLVLESTCTYEVLSIARRLPHILSVFETTDGMKSNDKAMKTVCRLVICILNHLDKRDNQSGVDAKDLRMQLFSLLLQVLPKTLKKDSASELNELLPSNDILGWLISLVHSHRKCGNLSLDEIEPSVYQKVFRSCLKHGISTRNESLSSLSLQLLALLLQVNMDEGLSESRGIPPSKDVFSMIASHSKFDSLFVESENDTGSPQKIKVREAVLKSMITCMKLSSESIMISPSTWRVVFASFNAGLTDLDDLVRQLVTVCSDSCTPFTDEIQWQGFVTDTRDQSPSRRFDWLIDALDTGRIRATISRFPVFDSVDQECSIDGIWLDKAVKISEKESANEGNHAFATHFEENRGTEGIQRYSPGFVLPLILKSIESGLTANQSSGPDKNKETDNEDLEEQNLPWIFSKSTVATVQQLCEKGVVSLCLASLSSLCEKVRCYAVSILGLVLQACLTSHALDFSSWRDRPQLLLILNSVQRSFLLRKKLDEDESVVPRVMPIIATFLARAALVLPKPDDALYVSINRYFLKNEADHGAFQDTNRLPAFMSLFCSSSDDSNQSRAERMWALQMLCDGLVDATCYRLVASCHAPELILSSFENVRLSQASEEAKGAEFSLLLEALVCMIKHGGYGAHIHLIRRSGLLSWMSSMCTSRSLKTALPTERSRIAFCKLATAIIGTVFDTPKLRSFEIVDELCALIEPLTSLGLIRCQVGQLNSDVYKGSLTALGCLSACLKKLRDEGVPCPDTLPTGVSLQSSLDILRNTNDSMREQSLQILCTLPIQLTRCGKDDIALELSVMILQQFEVISATSKLVSTDQVIVLVLKRIKLLAEKYEFGREGSSTNLTSKDMSEKVYNLRCHSKVSDANTRDLWSTCLNLLSENVHSEMDFELL